MLEFRPCAVLAVLSLGCVPEDAFARDPGLPALSRPDASAAVRDASHAKPPSVPRGEPDAALAAEDAAAPQAEDAELPPVELAGSAASFGCASYGLRDGEQCAGFYCGVRESELARVLRSSVCPDIDAQELCDGELERVTNRCAREVVSANLLRPVRGLFAELADCISDAVPEFADYPSDCQACTLEAIACGSERCAIECAAGDGAGCDACRMNKGCNAAAYTCAELPNPL